MHIFKTKIFSTFVLHVANDYIRRFTPNIDLIKTVSKF